MKLYRNGVIQTMRDGENCYAVLIEHGRIAAVGEMAEQLAKREKNVEIVDLRGAVLLPGFIDSHSHLTAYANSLLLCQLDGADSFDQIVTLLKQYETTHPEESWILGVGYDETLLVEKWHPTKKVLDAAFPDKPVVITHKSGHMGVLNTKALQLCQAGENDSEIDGGMIGKDENGELTGYLEEKAFINVTGKIPLPSRQQVSQAVLTAQERYFSYGITTIQEGKAGPKELSTLEMQPLSADVIVYQDVTLPIPLLHTIQQHITIGGYKLFLDGSPQAKTAWLSEPYEGEREYGGYPAYSDEQVQAYIYRAKTERQQLLVHCNGDAAIDQFIRCTEKVGDCETLRFVAIHAQLMRRDQLDRIKKLQILPSYFVAHTYYWGDVHRIHLGQRAQGISPLRSTLAMGIPFTLHQDTPVVEPDMLHTIWCATHRQTKSGQILGEEQCISTYDALRAITAHAAYQYFAENEKGTIEAGKCADFVILSDDPMQMEDVRQIRVLQTVKDGQVVYSGEKLE